MPSPPSPPSPPLHARYSDSVTFWKDVFEIGFRIGTLALPLPGLFLWIFLQSLGWTSLFMESALSGSGLIYLVVVTLLFFSFVLLSFSIPSLIMGASAAIYPATAPVPFAVILVHVAAIVGWLLTILIVMPIQPAFWVYLVAPALLVGLVFIGLSKQLGDGSSFPKWLTLICHFLIAIATVLATSFPMLVILKVAQYFPDFLQSESSGTMALFWLIMSVGTIPGYFYLVGRNTSTSMHARRGGAAAGLAVLAYFIVWFWMTNPEVRMMISKAIGLYGQDDVTFQVLEDDTFPVLEAAGLKTDRAGAVKTVTAIPTYRFGSVILLCKTDPKPFAADSVKSVDAPRGVNCIPLKESDLRELRIAQSPGANTPPPSNNKNEAGSKQ